MCATCGCGVDLSSTEEVAGGKLHGARVHGQERGIVMARRVASFVAGGTQIDTMEGGGCVLSGIHPADGGG
jgi:hypothetical protein